MCADRVKLRTWSIQGRNVTRNNLIDQSINQKGKEAPTITPPWVKDSNICRYITTVHLCAEVPHEVAGGQKTKHNKL